ncbi:MAG TPA: thioredoxin-disulfide reductase [Patescibacteria group bacterium]|nr:thioredoxin-disulfide reductase [Patescibacteria group bacterium]
MDQQIFSPRPNDAKGPWDIAVIGSGPAGLTASIYATRGAASTIIFGGEVWGGQLMLTTNVDNFPSQPGVLGPDLMGKMREHSVMFGAEFLQKNVNSIDVSKSPFELTVGSEIYTAKSIIVSTGAETKWLDVPGLSKLVGRGVSSCAPCDAPFFKDKKVAVIGGGDSAMEEALVLTKYALEVTIIHRREAFKASAAMQQKVLNNPKIKVLWNTEVVEIVGNEKLEKLLLKNNKTNETSELILDGLFIAIGHTPSTMIFQGKIELDARGYVVAKDRTKTSVPGIFVAGDVEDYNYKQAITAAGFGCMAAMDTLKYLEEFRNER